MGEKIVHIGYPKTGSTYLQQEIFPSLQGMKYVDFHTCVKLFEDVIYLDDLDYNRDQTSKAFSRYGKEESTLFSQEALTGPPFTFKGLNRSSIPQRLKELGFSKVIITIRNQSDILDSLYRQYVYQGGVMKFSDFLNLEERWNHQLRAFNLSYLRYDRLIQMYQETFGVSQVLVLPQELLKKDKHHFLSLLGTFIDHEIMISEYNKRSNESMSNLSTNLIRIINHFTFNSQRPNQLISNRISTRPIKKGFQVILDPYFLKYLSGKRSYLSAFQKKQVKAYFASSNAVLEELVDFNLKDFGYHH